MNKSIFQQTKVAPAPSVLPANVEKASQIFLDYLEDKLPPLLASDSLSLILRTDPPVTFGLQRIVDTVRSWAGRRSKDSGRPVVEFLTNALWRIGHADAAGVLDGFAAIRFFPEFINKLQALCPPDQQPAFNAKLIEIREYFEWNFSEQPQLVRHTVVDMEGIAIAGTAESDFNELAEHLIEASTLAGNPAFNKTITSLREQLYQPDFRAEQCLERLIETAITLFNNDKHQQAEQAFSLVREGLKLPQLSEESRGNLRSSHNSGELNQELLLRLLNDNGKQQSIKSVLQVLADLEAKNLLKRLRFEKDKEYRRLLLTLIKLHGPDVFPVIVEDLQASQKETRSWFYLRNLIFLLGKIPPPSDSHRFAAVNMTGGFLKNKYQQVRTAALSTLNTLGGEGAVDFLLEALNQEYYSSVDIKSEHLPKHLNNVIAFLARYPGDQTLTALAAIVAGSKLDFIPNSEPLKLSAYSLLKPHAAKLPVVTARFLTNHLENQLRTRGVGFGGFAVGINTESCLKVMDLLSYTRQPETMRLMTELKTKYARHALGRRAAEILKSNGK